MFRLAKDISIKNVGHAINYECHKMGYDFTEDEIKYVVISQMLNPEGIFSGKEADLEEDLKKLINISVSLLCNSSPTTLKTIMIQSAFIYSYTDRETVLIKYRKMIQEHTHPMVDDICTSEPRTSEEKDNLYKKLILITILLSGLGDPSMKNVYSNAQAALNSIFPIKNINVFVHLNSVKSKKSELECLSQTVSGIRLYNQARITNQEENPAFILVRDGCKALLDSIHPLLKNLTDLIKSLSRILNRNTCPDEVQRDKWIDPTDLLSPDEMIEGKNYLTLMQQAIIYISKLNHDALQAQEDYDKANQSFKSMILLLNKDLDGKHAIPMSKVSLKFKEMGSQWDIIQEVKVSVVSISNIVTTIVSHLELGKAPKWMKKLLSKKDKDDVSCKEFSNFVISTRMNLCETHYMIDMDQIKNCQYIGRINLSRSELEYHGFCLVTCLETQGLLLTGDTYIGLLRYKEKIFCFRDAEAAYTFDNDPDVCISAIIDFAARNIEYQDILNLRPLLFEGGCGFLQQKAKVIRMKPLKKEKFVQTEIHPIPEYIDRSYSWNVWDLRRKALSLANLKNLQTKSVQSVETIMKVNIALQTHSMRDQSCATKENKSIQISDQIEFFGHLRGEYPGTFIHYKRKVPSITCLKGAIPEAENTCEKN